MVRDGNLITAGGITSGIERLAKIGMPILFLPFSKTVWLAADLLMRPLEPGEVRPGYGPQPGEPATPRPPSRR